MEQAKIVIEAAVDNLDDALAAERAGVDRLELCGDLSIGGITPDPSLSTAVIGWVRIPVMVMIRPRGGDFVYAPGEIEQMLSDIEALRETRIAGFVTGALASSAQSRGLRVDWNYTQQLVNASAGLPVTFHRAFDRIENPGDALSDLIEIGLTSVLTSGRKASAAEGADNLRELIRSAGQDITIIAAGGIRAANARELLERTGASEIHSRYVSDREMRQLISTVAPAASA